VKCKGASFWDPIDGGGCWSCGGYNRTARSVKSAKACSKRVKAQPRPARFVTKFGCGQGQFFDPRRGGECWSCSAGWHRTVHPVTAERACSRTLGGIVGVQPDVCPRFVGALGKGRDGYLELEAAAEGLVKPMTEPLRKLMEDRMPPVKSPEALDRFLKKALGPLAKRNEEFQELQRFASQAFASRERLHKMMTDPDLLCGNDGRKVLQALQSAGLGPRKRAGLLDGLLIGEALAADRYGKVWALSAGLTRMVPGATSGVSWSVTLAWRSDRSDTRLFMSSTPVSYFTTRPGFQGALSAFYFPRATLDSFDLIDQVGFEAALSPGKYVDDAIKRIFPANTAKLIGLLPGGLIVTTDPLFQETPGIGTTIFSWPEKKAAGQGWVDLDFCFDVTVQLKKWTP
jgi:hypothetical protein